MFKEFKEYILSNHLIKGKKPILLAVSGGIDSMLMLHLCLKAELKIAVAHCNFNLRGKDSDDDEKFVKSFCKKNNVPFFNKKFNTKQYAKDNKISTQMAARQLRYDWFNKIFLENDFEYIATAHHKNDVAETILINIIRGTGIAGLHGIYPIKGNLIRPLLFASKAEINSYAIKNKLPFREDASNLKDDYLRNKIRHQIIPKLEKINSNIIDNFYDLSNKIKMDELLLNMQFEEIKKEYLSKKNGYDHIDLKITKHKVAKHILYKLLNEYGFNENDTLQIIESSQKKIGSLFYSKSHTLLVDRDCFIIKKVGSIKVNKLVKLEDQKEMIETPHYQILFERINTPPEKFEKNVLYCDKSLIAENLIIKSWGNGDKFVPLGMKNKKLVSDYLIDKKINQFEKEKCLILQVEKTSEIVAILPYQISNHYKLTANTKDILKISIFQT